MLEQELADKGKGIERGSRRQTIVREVLLDVFQGVLRPGQRLKVEHLAKRYGVSATPIREALVELAGIGVAELAPNRGAVLRPFGQQQLREICQVRRILESEATRCACGRIDPHELSQLEDELAQLLEGDRGPDWSDNTRAADTRLHELIRQHCGSERLAYEIGRYGTMYRVLRDVVHERLKARSDYAQIEENTEHRAIVRALRAEQPAAAAEAMQHHIQQSANTLEHDLFAQFSLPLPPRETFATSPEMVAAH